MDKTISFIEYRGDRYRVKDFAHWRAYRSSHHESGRHRPDFAAIVRDYIEEHGGKLVKVDDYGLPRDQPLA